MRNLFALSMAACVNHKNVVTCGMEFNPCFFPSITLFSAYQLKLKIVATFFSSILEMHACTVA